MSSLRLGFVLVVLVSALASAGVAQTAREPIPEPVAQGFNAYAQSGLEAALEVWLRQSLLDRSILSKSELLALKHAEAAYGGFQGGEVLRTARLTTRVSRVYLVLYYDRAPLWGYFDLYVRQNGSTVITDMLFSTKVGVILPNELIVP